MDDLKRYGPEELKELCFEPEASFEDIEFYGVDFTGVSLKSVSFLNCRFYRCNLANLEIANTGFRGVLFQECNLIGLSWWTTKRFELCHFRECKLNFSSFNGLKLKKLEVIQCQANEVDFSQTDLSQSNFTYSQLKGANFDKADLTGSDFRNSQGYLFDLRTAKIKGAKFSYPEVLSLIMALGAQVE